jgi:tol-pal system protein YbgF
MHDDLCCKGLALMRWPTALWFYNDRVARHRSPPFFWKGHGMMSSLSKHLIGAWLVTACLFAFASACLAQGDGRDYANRLQRLEADMQALSREVYRGRPPGAGAPTALATPSNSNNVAADFEVRLLRLEGELQTLTGRYEEAAYQAAALREQLTKMQADMEFRLNKLESGASALASAEPPVQRQLGGEVRPAPSGSVAPVAAAPATGAGKPEPAPLDPQEQYAQAFELLQAGEYARAEKALAAFLKQHPTHALAANAQYWLGETLYVRRSFKEAAIAFAEAYQKFPKSQKAPDSLLKLGMALGNLNDKQGACVALGQLQAGYKDAPATIKRRAEQERNRLKCG